jgi:hypothetical protein
MQTVIFAAFSDVATGPPKREEREPDDELVSKVYPVGCNSAK